MTRIKTTFGLVILFVLLVGCAPQTPAAEELETEPTADPTTPALSPVDEAEPAAEATSTEPASTEEPLVERPTPTTAPDEYPPLPTLEPAPLVDSYPSPEEIVARQEAGGYPAENMEMADEPNPADADVLFVKATEAADGSWTFEVTVEHLDTGWEDYADGWDVITTQGNVLKVEVNDPFTRLLLHPHENEQPFTRSQSGLFIPSDVTEVFVRAHDSVYGWGGETVYVNLNTAEGQNYEVVRNEE